MSDEKAILIRAYEKKGRRWRIVAVALCERGAAFDLSLPAVPPGPHTFQVSAEDLLAGQRESKRVPVRLVLRTDGRVSWWESP